MERLKFVWIVLFLVLVMLRGPALANKAVVAIEGTSSGAKGSEVTLKITVTHSANSALHYTEWLKVTAGGKEIARWNYTSSQRPEAAVFTKEVKVKILENVEISAEANCNVHGSQGPATLKLSVKE
jgi:desulfoferrodoxin (superoxide reductase-like protein)